MTPDELEQRKARLREVGALCADHDERLRERNTLLRLLRSEGVARSELAELAGVSTENLKWVLSDRSQRSRSTAPARGAR